MARWLMPFARMIDLTCWNASIGSVSTLVLGIVASSTARSARAGAMRGPNAPTLSRKRSCWVDPDTSTVYTGR